MDAFTQLLESYVSRRASPFTDALASSGMRAFRDGFWQAWTPNDPLAQQGYQKLAYASLCSGITLAQCGLGSVHGLASPLGAFFPIPHGVVCGTLVAAATRGNIQALRAREPASPALRKYAEAGVLLAITYSIRDGRRGEFFDLMRELRFRRSQAVQHFARGMQGSLESWFNSQPEMEEMPEAHRFLAEQMSEKCSAHFGGVLQSLAERTAYALGRDVRCRCCTSSTVPKRARPVTGRASAPSSSALTFTNGLIAW